MQQFFIVCPLLFLAGFIDAIGGGGGLISLPGYLLAGLPIHNAIATNKLSSTCGTTLATWKYIRQGLVNWKLVVPAALVGVAGSSCGAEASMLAAEGIMEMLLLVILPLAALIVLRSRSFSEEGDLVLDRRTWITALVSALAVGFYDGFYGPGTGTFLIIAFTAFAHMPLKKANAHAKVINLTTNLTSLAVFLTGGQVVFLLGIAGAVCNMAGNILGAELALKRGGRITKPVILVVLGLLVLKVAGII